MSSLGRASYLVHQFRISRGNFVRLLSSGGGKRDLGKSESSALVIDRSEEAERAVIDSVEGVVTPLPQAFKQSANRDLPWSPDQRPRFDAYASSPRFSGIDLSAQPQPLSALELLNEEPVEVSHDRVVSCDGGGPLGHPSVYINLDNNEVMPCMYCGKKFRFEAHH